MYRDLAVAELASRLGTDRAPVLIDVREPEEYADWSIPGARNVPLAQLVTRMDEIPLDVEVVTVCASGNRSALAAEVLSRAGRRVANLAGGMVAWGGAYDSVTIELDGLRVVQIRRRGKGCLSYLVGTGGEAFAVDPSTDLGIYLDLADEHGWRISRVFDTHLHADHLSGARRLADATGASLHLNSADSFGFPYRPLADGDRFELPGAVTFGVAAMHAPGHTRGSTAFLVGEDVILSSDTLFVDGVGRPDLADEAEAFAHDLYDTVQRKLLTRREDSLVLPAHYGDSVEVRPDRPVGATLGELRAGLEVLGLDEDAFVAWASGSVSARPPNYVAIVQANMGRPSAPLADLRALELGPNRCSVSA